MDRQIFRQDDAIRFFDANGVEQQMVSKIQFEEYLDNHMNEKIVVISQNFEIPRLILVSEAGENINFRQFKQYVREFVKVLNQGVSKVFNQQHTADGKKLYVAFLDKGCQENIRKALINHYFPGVFMMENPEHLEIPTWNKRQRYNKKRRAWTRTTCTPYSYEHLFTSEIKGIEYDSMKKLQYPFEQDRWMENWYTYDNIRILDETQMANKIKCIISHDPDASQIRYLTPSEIKRIQILSPNVTIIEYNHNVNTNMCIRLAPWIQDKFILRKIQTELQNFLRYYKCTVARTDRFIIYFNDYVVSPGEYGNILRAIRATHPEYENCLDYDFVVDYVVPHPHQIIEGRHSGALITYVTKERYCERHKKINKKLRSVGRFITKHKNLIQKLLSEQTF